MPLRSGGAGRPVFVVHSIIGIAEELKPLAGALPAGRPVYGLRSPGLEPSETPFRRVEDLAAAYLRRICAVQPRGPYVLAGFSFGGQIAFEMARRLREEGEDIELLALIDTGFRRRDLPLSARLRAKFSWACQAVRRLTARRPHEWLPHPRRALRTWRAQRDENWQVQIAMADALPPLPPRRRAVLEGNVAAARAYAPRPYPGVIHYFQAADRRGRHDDPVPGWQKLSRGVRLFRIPGEHASMIQEPHVRVLAREIAACLVQRPSRAPDGAPVREIEPHFARS